MSHVMEALRIGEISGSSQKRHSRVKIRTPKEVIYPERDGKPMSDNTKQFEWIVKIKEGLEIMFANNPDVFVAGDLLWYPVEGSNKIRIAPDAMVVFGRPKGHRGSYRQWEEGHISPQIVFEVLSPGNTPKEMKKKLKFYERHGVEEYYEYDPDHIVLNGWIRTEDMLREIAFMNGWKSPKLGIRFEIADDLVIRTPDGKRFLTPVEMKANSERNLSEVISRFDSKFSDLETKFMRRLSEMEIRLNQEKLRSQMLEAKLRESQQKVRT